MHHPLSPRDPTHSRRLLMVAVVLLVAHTSSRTQVPIYAETSEILVIDAFETFRQPERHLDRNPVLTENGWTVIYDRGVTSVEAVRDTDPLLNGGSSQVLKISGRDNSYNVSRRVPFEYISRYPYLQWKWKVSDFPAGADISDPRKDDGAAQIYVNFDLKTTSWGYPCLVSVCYFYGVSMLPGETYLWDGFGTFVKFICLRSVATDDTHRWFAESRNVLEDYRDAVRDFLSPRDARRSRRFRRMFLEATGQTGDLTNEYISELKLHSLAIWVDSNDTRSGAESFYDDIAFRAP